MSMRMSGSATPSRRRHAFEPVTRPSSVIQRNTEIPLRTNAVCSTSMMTASGTSSLSSFASWENTPAYTPSSSVSTRSPTSIGYVVDRNVAMMMAAAIASLVTGLSLCSRVLPGM